MKRALLSLTVLFVLFLSSTMLADEFWGKVIYKNCDCTRQHLVKILKDEEGAIADFHRVRCGGNPIYLTQPYTYTTGWYYISVIGLGETECETSSIEYVYHVGGSEHRVDVTVYGPQGQPNAPGGGE